MLTRTAIACAAWCCAVAHAQPNHTGLYWNPAQSGWGMHLSHQGSTIFATVFSYLGGMPVWLVASDVRQAEPHFFDGSFYHTRGTPFATPSWSAPTVDLGGRFWLDFSVPGRVTVGIIAGPRGAFSIVTLERQVYGTPPVCTFTTAPREGVTNYQDLWWNPAESGWGLSLAHQGDVIFATMFVYDAQGDPVWVAGPNLARGDDGSYSGVLYRGHGGGSYTTPLQWTAPSFAQVGLMRLEFSSGTEGTLTYTLDGIARTKAIRRQVFAASTALCR